ncbi:hypothetical protein PS2_007144 [Malus domestica]
MGPTSSPPSSTATLLSNPSSPASTLLALAIPTNALPDLQPSPLLRSLSAADTAHFYTSPMSDPLLHLLPESPSPISLRRRHRPFLHLTHVGTLVDNFFSGDDDNAHSFFAPILIFSSSSHSTSKLGFIGTYGTRVSKIVRYSLTFKAEKFTISDDIARGRDGNRESNVGRRKAAMKKWTIGPSICNS